MYFAPLPVLRTGEEGFEPSRPVLETGSLPLAYSPRQKPVISFLYAVYACRRRRKTFLSQVLSLFSCRARNDNSCFYRPCKPVLLLLCRPLIFSSSTCYSTTSVTTPEPTVCPPSRTAKRTCFSSATGVISSTSTAMLSPGITISTPFGRLHMPVTSVVLK